MSKPRRCRIITHALQHYQRRIYISGSRKDNGHIPKAYEGILTLETVSHVWLSEVPQYDGQSRTFAIPRRSIVRREFAK